jgi:hypothetical protein
MNADEPDVLRRAAIRVRIDQVIERSRREPKPSRAERSAALDAFLERYAGTGPYRTDAEIELLVDEVMRERDEPPASAAGD